MNQMRIMVMMRMNKRREGKKRRSQIRNFGNHFRFHHKTPSWRK